MEQYWSKEYFSFFQEVGLKDGRIERLKLELERKDAEIQKLKAVITQWEVCPLTSGKNYVFAFCGFCMCLLFSYSAIQSFKLTIHLNSE